MRRCPRAPRTARARPCGPAMHPATPPPPPPAPPAAPPPRPAGARAAAPPPAQASSRAHSRHREICDPTAWEFAAAPAVLSPDNATLLPPDFESDWQSGQPASWRRLIEGAASPMCEMLGPRQRLWLRERLSGPAALKLVASGSVLAGSLGHPEAEGTSECDGDDWACWRPAQVGPWRAAGSVSLSWEWPGRTRRQPI
jgi:hypothetical protein